MKEQFSQLEYAFLIICNTYVLIIYLIEYLIILINVLPLHSSGGIDLKPTLLSDISDAKRGLVLINYYH